MADTDVQVRVWGSGQRVPGLGIHVDSSES